MNLSLDPLLTALTPAVWENGNSLDSVVKGQPTLRPPVRGKAVSAEPQGSRLAVQARERKHNCEERYENDDAHAVALTSDYAGLDNTPNWGDIHTTRDEAFELIKGIFALLGRSVKGHSLGEKSR